MKYFIIFNLLKETRMTFELICMALIGIVFGLVVAFFGYRLFLVLLPIWGFFFGFGLGAQAVSALFGSGFLADVTSWVVGFIIGLIFAVLSYLFYIVGVAIFSASLGYGLGIALMGLIGSTGILAFIVGVVLAIIVAGVVLVLNIQKLAIEVVSSAGGAAVALAGLLIPFGVFTVADLESGGVVQTVTGESWLWAVLWLAVAVLAFVFQMRTNRSYDLAVPESQW
jgi:hypothetical protein